MSTGLAARLVARRDSTFRVDLELGIEVGETVALLGPNGAGKSTVVAALAGLLPLEKGYIRLHDAVLDDPERELFVAPERRNIGVVFQEYVLFPHLSVLENVAFGLRSRGIGHGEALQTSLEWLERFGLSRLGEKAPGDISGGEAQRVALARALVVEPDLLLLDEPLAALDVGTRASLRRDLAGHLASFEGPRLLITHDPTEAFLLADRISVIESGVVTQEGTANELRLRPRTEYAAGVADVNLVSGVAAGGVVDTGAHALHIADHGVSGPVLAIIRPASISIHLGKPEGSPRNTWQTTVDVVEHLGDRVRLRTGDPLPLTVEITEESSRALALAAGSRTWVSMKATEIVVEPDR